MFIGPIPSHPDSHHPVEPVLMHGSVSPKYLFSYARVSCKYSRPTTLACAVSNSQVYEALLKHSYDLRNRDFFLLWPLNSWLCGLGTFTLMKMPYTLLGSSYFSHTPYSLFLYIFYSYCHYNSVYCVSSNVFSEQVGRS